MWTSVSGDDALATASEDLINQIDAPPKSQGHYNRWKYLNYGAGYQNIIARYGAESVAHLRVTNVEYDPPRMFQAVVPEVFKLSN